MQIATTLLVLLVLSALAAAVRRTFWRGLCPLCAGVSLTWMLLLGAAAWGLPVDLRLPAILMGGSVVGLAAALERRAPARSAGTALVWKTMFLAIGFGAAYAVLLADWRGIVAGVLGLALVSAWLLRRPGKAVSMDTGQQNTLMAELERCC